LGISNLLQHTFKPIATINSLTFKL